MTPAELKARTTAAEAVKAAWIAGFQAARHWPNHSLPELSIDWEGSTPRVVPNWNHKKKGWVG